MKAILNIISRFAALLIKLTGKSKPVPLPDAHAEMLNTIIRAEHAIYDSIMLQLKNDPDLPRYGAELRMLHRRLAQYERLRNHASLADQDKALRKLEKQWRKVEHIGNRRSHKDNDLKSFNGDLVKLNLRSAP